jgi:uncharacterized DUF497 family protein
MDIGFIWDEKKYQTTVKRHKVLFYEVVSAFDDPNGYEISDPTGYEDRWMWVGKTHAGRILTIVYSEEDLPLYRIITAYDAERRWYDEYDQGTRI